MEETLIHLGAESDLALLLFVCTTHSRSWEDREFLYLSVPLGNYLLVLRKKKVRGITRRR